MAKNVNQKGRRQEPRHIRLYHTVTGCDAWLDLSGNAVKLLVALMRLDKGGDNGTLFLSIRHAATALGVHRNTAVRLFRELEDHGFIAPSERGHFSIKGGPATSWRLTWLAAQGRGPSRDFERWQRPDGNKSRAQKCSAAGPKIVPLNGNDDPMGTEIVPADMETPLVSVEAQCTKTVPQIVCHGHRVPSADSAAGKQANSANGVSTDLLGTELLDALRGRLQAYLADAPVGAQTRLAQSAGIPGGTLSKFVGGRGLARMHFVSLQLELVRAQREAA